MHRQDPVWLVSASGVNLEIRSLSEQPEHMRKSCCMLLSKGPARVTADMGAQLVHIKRNPRPADEAVAAVAATSFPFEVPKLSESMQASEVDFKRGLLGSLRHGTATAERHTWKSRRTAPGEDTP